jgi:hypothetical protein
VAISLGATSAWTALTRFPSSSDRINFHRTPITSRAAWRGPGQRALIEHALPPGWNACRRVFPQVLPIGEHGGIRMRRYLPDASIHEWCRISESNG